jgi:hypothetical protein
MPDTDKLINVIDAYSEQSIGSQSDSGELSRQRGLALDSYAGKNIEPAPEGRSQVVDWSVFETVQWIMPSLMRIFAGDDTVVEFAPVSSEDEDAAEQESLHLNNLVMQSNDWELICRQWMQDALITKNAYCMVSMEEKLHTELERYEQQTEEQIALLMQDQDVQIVGQRQYDDPEDEGVLIDPTTGTPAQDEETMVGAMAIYESQGMEPQFLRRQLFDVEVRRVKPIESLKFRVLPPERCRVAKNCDDFTLEDCDYFEFWDARTISELRKLGYDIPDDISSDDAMFDTDTTEDTARDEILQLNRYTGGRELEDMEDPALKEVICRWIWVKHDYDEDGIAELQHVVRVGKRIFERQEVSCVPVACIVPFINTHRHMGVSVADLVFDIQRIKTALLRGGLDSLNLSINPRHAVSNSVNLDDLLTSRPGGVVRLKQGAIPGEGHVLPLTTEFVFPQAQEGLRHMDTMIESRVGVNRIFQGIDEGNLNQHDRVGQLSTMAAQRVEDIARVFGIGFKRLFRIAHEIVVKSGHSQEVIEINGEWIDINPSKWMLGRDMRVTAPYAAGNKDALLDRLLILKQIHAEALSGGLPIVTPEDSYELGLEIAKAADITGAKFFTDPNLIPPPPEEPDHTMIALEIEKKKAETQDRNVEGDAELGKYRADLDAEMDKYKADLNAELQLALAQIKSGGQADLEKLKADFKNAPVDRGNDAINAQSEALNTLSSGITEFMNAVSDSIKELREQQDAPIEIVRENGKITGKKVNGKFIPLRDAT